MLYPDELRALGREGSTGGGGVAGGAGMSGQGGGDQSPGKALVARRVVGQADVSGAGIGRGVVHATVGVDLQHVRGAEAAGILDLCTTLMTTHTPGGPR